MIFSLRVQHSCFVSHLCKKRFNAISASFPGDLRLVLIKRIPPSLLHPSFNSPSRPDRPSPAPYSRHFLAVPAFELEQSVCAALNFIYLELRKPPIWVARANFHTVFVCKAIVARSQCARQTIYARWAARPLYIQGIKVSGWQLARHPPPTYYALQVVYQGYVRCLRNGKLNSNKLRIFNTAINYDWQLGRWSQKSMEFFHELCH